MVLEFAGVGRGGGADWLAKGGLRRRVWRVEGVPR